MTVLEFLFITSTEERTLNIKHITEGRYEHSANHYADITLKEVDSFLHGNSRIGDYISPNDRYGRHTCIVRLA